MCSGNVEVGQSKSRYRRMMSRRIRAWFDGRTWTPFRTRPGEIDDSGKHVPAKVGVLSERLTRQARTL